MTWTPEQLLARADLLDRVSEGSKNAEYLDTLRMEAWALRTAAASIGVRDTIERILNFPHGGDSAAQAMSQLAGDVIERLWPSPAQMTAAQFEDNLKRCT